MDAIAGNDTIKILVVVINRNRNDVCDPDNKQ